MWKELVITYYRSTSVFFFSLTPSTSIVQSWFLITYVRRYLSLPVKQKPHNQNTYFITVRCEASQSQEFFKLLCNRQEIFFALFSDSSELFEGCQVRKALNRPKPGSHFKSGLRTLWTCQEFCWGELTDPFPHLGVVYIWCMYYMSINHARIIQLYVDSNYYLLN